MGGDVAVHALHLYEQDIGYFDPLARFDPPLRGFEDREALRIGLINEVHDLDALDAASIPFAIGSNGSDEKMQITLGQHGLIPRFKGLFSGQTLGKPKPAPDLYLHAARALGANPAHCVVIEDSPTGARAAKAAGMRCMGYAPHGPADHLANEGAIPFTRMTELPALLGL